MLYFNTVYNSPVLSNNNQTLTCNIGSGCGLIDKIENEGKKYLEIKLNVIGVAPYIGICNADTMFKSSYIGYPPYNNTDDLITTSVSQITALGILSILLDCTNKHIKILLNNSKILIDKNYIFNNVRLIMGVGYSSRQGGGGGGQFIITNKENLYYSIPSNYVYYGSNNKFLIKQGSLYYSIKPEFYQEESDEYNPQLISTIDINNFDTYGLDDLSLIHSNALLKLIEHKYNLSMLK